MAVNYPVFKSKRFPDKLYIWLGSHDDEHYYVYPLDSAGMYYDPIYGMSLYKSNYWVYPKSKLQIVKHKVWPRDFDKSDNKLKDLWK